MLHSCPDFLASIRISFERTQSTKEERKVEKLRSKWQLRNPSKKSPFFNPFIFVESEEILGLFFLQYHEWTRELQLLIAWSVYTILESNYDVCFYLFFVVEEKVSSYSNSINQIITIPWVELLQQMLPFYHQLLSTKLFFCALSLFDRWGLKVRECCKNTLGLCESLPLQQQQQSLKRSFAAAAF